MKTLLTTFVMVFVLMACGSAQDMGKGTDKSSTTDSSSPSATPSSTSAATDLNGNSYLLVEGYVSPIDISVNSTMYRDSEDFYTQELRKLQDDVYAKYPDYTLSFNASVGLENFKEGMLVFLVATSDVGVASESQVDATGKFTFQLPGTTNRKVMYTLHATKRISLSLTKDKNVIQWCYNLYAEKQVVLDGTSNILRDFNTVVTEYQCSDPNNTIGLPDLTPAEEAIIASDAAEVKRTADINTAAAAAMNPTPTPTPTSKAN